MGYTHYFAFLDKEGNRTNKIDKGKFALASDIIKNFAEKLTKKGLILAGPLGEGSPIFDHKLIAFNGKGDDSCESIYIDREGSFVSNYRSAVQHHGYWYGVIGQAFCKTDRNPYDILVCLTLLTLKSVFKDQFEFHSDGLGKVGATKSVEWEKAYEVWNNFAKGTEFATV